MKCPGQDSRYWRPEAIFDVKCPNCGEMIEFFKDDTRRRCPACGQEVPNPEMDFGCAAYCPYAEQCLGSLFGETAGDGKLNILKRKMLREIRNLLQNDGKKVAEATIFLELCEELGKKEGADLGLVLLAGFATLYLPAGIQSEDLLKRFQQVREKLLEIGAEEKTAEDALSLIDNGLSGRLQDEKDLKNYDVIKDASVISSFQAEAEDDGEKLSDKLLTDSAKQFVRNRAATN